MRLARARTARALSVLCLFLLLLFVFCGWFGFITPVFRCAGDEVRQQVAHADASERRDLRTRNPACRRGGGRRCAGNRTAFLYDSVGRSGAGGVRRELRVCQGPRCLRRAGRAAPSWWVATRSRSGGFARGSVPVRAECAR